MQPTVSTVPATSAKMATGCLYRTNASFHSERRSFLLPTAQGVCLVPPQHPVVRCSCPEVRKRLHLEVPQDGLYGNTLLNPCRPSSNTKSRTNSTWLTGTAFNHPHDSKGKASCIPPESIESNSINVNLLPHNSSMRQQKYDHIRKRMSGLFRQLPK